MNEIEELIIHQPEAALNMIGELLQTQPSADLLWLRIDIYQKLNRMTDALNDCIEYIKVYGADEKIQSRKQYFETIIFTSQLDIYACTNLHNDPWD